MEEVWTASTSVMTMCTATIRVSDIGGYLVCQGCAALHYDELCFARDCNNSDIRDRQITCPIHDWGNLNVCLMDNLDSQKLCPAH